MGEEIRQLMNELVTALNSHDPDRVTACYAPDYEGTNVTRAQPLQGTAAIQQTVRDYLQAIPDLHITHDLLIEANRVVLIWIAQGTHQGTLLRIPATGRSINIRGMSLFTIEHGKIQRGLHVWDVAGLLRTLGLLPDL